MYLSWIIPAYNEERRIEKTISEVDGYLQSKHFSDSYEILVVDASSKDNTASIVEYLKTKIPHLALLNVENKGKGWAVRRGMLESKGAIRLFSDADNSTAPEYFDAMQALFKQGYDIVISSRNPRDVHGATRDIKEPWARELFGKLGNVIIQLFGVWGIWDTQNGFKALTARAAGDIFKKSLIKGFAFDIEILALARRLQYQIGIIPIQWKFDPDSKVTASAYIKVFIDVFKIRWNFLTNKYHL